MITLSKCSPTTPDRHADLVWALPFSLATTWGIIVIFFSSPYLDVSVQEVGFLSDIKGCPIRRSADIMLVCSFPQLIAAYHVLHRLSDPRHPPCALISFKNLHFPYSPFATAVQIFNFMRLKNAFPICQRTYKYEVRCTKYECADDKVMNPQGLMPSP